MSSPLAGHRTFGHEDRISCVVNESTACAARNRWLAHCILRREVSPMNESKHTANHAPSAGPVESLLQDIRYALRTLRRSPGFTLVAVLILALGIGANTSIFSVISAVLLRPLPFPDPDRLVVVFEDRSGGSARLMPNQVDYVEWQRRSDSFDGIAAIADISYNLTGEGEPERLGTSHATPNLFAVLGTQALLGRTFTPDDIASTSL